ncbi:MAG: hypothetical protein HBSAPP03_20260 [Phycisphaerae bacterium]|nr:MAG: hypothetical protein HBSAPP03_20260 [Phycisphaerae bacterium]
MNRTTHRATRIASLASLALVSLAGAFPNVVNGPLPPPPPSPNEIGRSGYQGSENTPGPNGHWPNTLPPNQQGLMGGSSYNPTTHMLTLNNHRMEDYTKHLWVRVVTNQENGYNPPGGGAAPGQPAGAGVWGSCTAPNSTSTMTGAGWQRENFNGASLLVLYMTWDITPQPAVETVDLSNIAAGLNNGRRIIGIQAVSVCTPTVPAPGALALAGLGGLFLARRRRS